MRRGLWAVFVHIDLDLRIAVVTVELAWFMDFKSSATKSQHPETDETEAQAEETADWGESDEENIGFGEAHFLVV